MLPSSPEGNADLVLNALFREFLHAFFARFHREPLLTVDIGTFVFFSCGYNTILASKSRLSIKIFTKVITPCSRRYGD